MKKMNVCVVTGTRAEFGIWRPVLRAIDASKKLELQLIVTGMHLLPEFGETVNDIRAEGFHVDVEVEMYAPTDTPADSLASGTSGIATALRALKSDLVMVLGDRLEILAAAGAALSDQIPIAHVHGGETAPGQWDEQIRHAVTKMAHMHFCATEAAARRILQMGEDPKSIHVVGAPALDSVAEFLESDKALLAEALRAGAMEPDDGTAVLLLHPSSPDEKTEEGRAKMVLEALGGVSLDVIGPNNDPGHKGILRAYKKAGLWVKMSEWQDDFWLLLSQASVLVGNSSSGILEAASLGCPVVNIGERQAGRERNGNVIDVPWQAGAEGIEKTVTRAMRDKKFVATVAKRQNLYGDGKASERIVKVLEGMKGRLPTVKRWHDG